MMNGNITDIKGKLFVDEFGVIVLAAEKNNYYPLPCPSYAANNLRDILR